MLQTGKQSIAYPMLASFLTCWLVTGCSSLSKRSSDNFSGPNLGDVGKVDLAEFVDTRVSSVMPSAGPGGFFGSCSEVESSEDDELGQKSAMSGTVGCENCTLSWL